MTTISGIGNRVQLQQTATDVDLGGALDGSSHTVQPGETLASIAESRGMSVDDLRRANPSLANRSEATLLIPGAQLNLSVPPAPAEPAPEQAPGATPAAPERQAEGRQANARTDAGMRAQLESGLTHAAPSLEGIRGGEVMTTGARGEAARHVNERLNKLGYKAPRGDAYTSDTAKAVMAFQRDHNIQQNGKVGRTTLGALDQAGEYRAHVNVPAYRQTTPVNCDDTCEKMMRAQGTVPAGSDAGVNYFANSRNPSAAKERGVQYLEDQLRNGKPVMIGVDYKAGSPNADGRTDHFLVATGFGTDEKGRRFISFNDPADGSSDAKRNAGGGYENRLYLQNGNWTQVNHSKPYVLSAVVDNVR